MTSTELTRKTIVPFLTEIFERRGAEEYLGEHVTIAEHMLQGAQLAEEAGSSNELTAAILLHDIGHFTHDFPVDAAEQGIDSRHEVSGAGVIERFFPEMVVDCVRLHVDAKRYLCAVDPGYVARLSPASVLSLELQGGAMGEAEAAAFGQNPNIDDIVQVRIWDDLGKEPTRKTPEFGHYMPMLQRVVDRHMTG